MSRSKKSRKPGSAPTAKPKLSKVELANVEKRIRKTKGKKPGNRQQEAMQVKKSDQQVNQHKDPRIGSKKPIELGAAVSQPKSKPVKATQAKQDPIAVIRVVNTEAEPDFSQELENIENDEGLQAILAKQEEELALTEQEVNYFNELMERHQQLTEKLAENEEPEDEPSRDGTSSEDDLWDKLDNSSLPDDFDKF
ncbi:MAG: GTPase-activating protein [Gammaproteobacteria bacterium]|nr:MAG: GTPase-activating protein [Gammaproteobacteria bacterium]PHR85300.1 MAG: GTPase-activating protein [Colwellia sp.]